MSDHIQVFESSDDRALRIARIMTGSFAPSQDIIDRVRRTLPSPPTPGFERADEVLRLLEIMRGSASYQECQAALRQVGVAIFASGGFAAMQSVAAELRHQFPGGEKKPANQCFEGEDNLLWHPSQIDFAWDGVGSWRS